MRAPFRESPCWGWDDDHPLPLDAGPVSLMVDVADDDEPVLLDDKGRPVPRIRVPFGFCGQPKEMP